jgi:D-lactate dehydrogenase
MNIAIFDLKPEEKKLISQRLKGHTVTYFTQSLQEIPIKKFQNAEIISLFISSSVDGKTLSSLPRLKLIATRSTGFDHIDLKEASARKIIVTNVPSYGENTVAEHTFALILTLSRNIHQSYLRTQKKNFSIEGLKGFDLCGKTLGVIGTGKIGSHVIRIANGFQMNVLAYDTFKNKKLAKEFNFSYVDLKTLLQKSDIITLHLPLLKETEHIINTKNIKYIKRGALLINTARGGLIETSALIQALDKKIISEVGLDVLEEENVILEEHHLSLHGAHHRHELGMLIKNHKLLQKPNIIFTPHIAFYSQEAVDRITNTTIDNILAFIKGKKQNRVILK